MSEDTETPPNESLVVNSIRENVRDNLKIARIKNRNAAIDGLRIAPEELENLSINLQNFSVKDVSTIVQTIKKHKHAKPTELSKLSHAFLQSTENILCFLNTTGALNVLVKELTGTDFDAQILAIECLCNLSLGSEISCEKVALHAGTYFHTFLTSSNEWLVRSSLWCLTNLIVAGKKSLNVLLGQELIPALISLNSNCTSDTVKLESYVALEMVIDHCEKSSWRQTDLEKFSTFIFQHFAPIEPQLTTIAYKYFDMIDFHSHDETALGRLLELSLNTLFHIHDTHNVTSETSVPPDTQRQIILLIRMCSNIVAIQSDYVDWFIENIFQPQSRSMSSIFNYFIDLVATNTQFVREINWFLGNLINSPFSNNSLAYLESDGFFANINVINC